MDSQAPIALITGGNQGIGLAVAKQLASDHNYHVIIGSRNSVAGEQIAESIRKEGYQASSIQLDLSSDESIASAAHELQKFGHLDVLINNAGILIDYIPGFVEMAKDLTPRERFRKTFDTNVFGTAVLTETILPLLQKADRPRIVFVSSIMGSLSKSLDKTTACYNLDYKIYDSSKAAMNMVAMNYARILEKGFVNVVCPGLNKTNLTRFAMGNPPEVGAKRIVEVATSFHATGTFTDINGEILW